MERDHAYFVYIMASKRNGTLYVGVTNNVYRRALEHKTGKAGSFTKRYGITRLVYFEEFQNIQQAIAREKQLKKGTRKTKLALIETSNPQWADLFEAMT
ncbi:MAG: GIY-YIG nuclease family protein [Pseudomonadota bacterium]